LLLERLSSEVRGPAERVELADALTEAFIFALDHLSPTERAVYLLREAFAFDYGDIASVVDRSEENCRQILRRARERITAKESSAQPFRERNRSVVSEFLNAAETGELEPLLKLLSDEAALARDAGDLSKPVPPLIRDREILFQTLGNTLAQMRNGSDGFTLFTIGHDYAYVARCGITAKGAILLRVIEHKVAAVRLVSCPVLLHQLQILMALGPGRDCQPGSAHERN
jgi:RNA polymerase sigma-70 factor (ECF subfamily)